ncbi:GEVED domain-containing protein (plasmid) [Marinovum sp. KMM 9989]
MLSPILSGLLGTDVGVSVLDWNAIASADLSLLDILGETGAAIAVSDPGQVLDADITLLDLIDASTAVAEADGNTALVSALDALSLPVAELEGTINLVDLISVGLPDGALADVSLNALDLIGGAIQLYNYENVVTTTEPIALEHPILESLGIGGAEVLLQVVEPPHFECGGAGTKFHTATVRLKVSLDLADTTLDTSALSTAVGLILNQPATVDASLAQLDFYFEFGRVDGEIVSTDAAAKTASVILAPSAIDAFLGSIDDSIFFNRSRAIEASDVDFANVGTLDIASLDGLVQESATIGVKSFAQSAPGTAQTLFFQPPYPQRQSIGDGASSFSQLLGSLAENMDIEVSDTLGDTLGPTIDTTIEPLVQDLVGNVLVDAISPALDATVDPLLAFFGVGLGEAEASIGGVVSRCIEASDCPVDGVAPDGISLADYGSPTHLIYDYLFMGAAPPDEDTTSRASAEADGDDLDGVDDEDGVLLPPMSRGVTHQIEVTLAESAGVTGYLQGWIDWDGNGIFDPDERIAEDLTAPGGGTILIDVAVPADAVLGRSFSRFRWSSTPALAAIGAASDGEVEDHAVTIGATPSPRLSGTVFADTGISAATPHNGIPEPDEPGLSGVTVQVFDDSGTLIASAVTGPDGTWALTLPAGFEGPVSVTMIPPPGYRPISETTGDVPGLLASDPNDATITFDISPDTVLTDLTLGAIASPRLSQDGTVHVEAGQVALIEHHYLAGGDGFVDFSLENLEAATGDVVHSAVFRDVDCDGDADEVISAPIPVTAQERVCVVVRSSVSTGAPRGARYSYDLIASSTYDGTAITDTRSNTDTLIIGRDTGQVTLVKTVENVTMGTPGSRANTGFPGDVLIYRIRLSNTSASAIADVSVRDMTPSNTVASYAAPPEVSSGGPACDLTTPQPVVAGYVGALHWQCSDDLPPGAFVTLSFAVKIVE